MSQQVFDKYWPLGNASAQEAIPGTAILQTRDGKDEPINLAGAMVWDAGSSLWVPVSENNPLPIALSGRLPAWSPHSGVLVHNAITVNANQLSPSVPVDVTGYARAIVLVAFDQAYSFFDLVSASGSGGAATFQNPSS